MNGLNKDALICFPIALTKTKKTLNFNTCYVQKEYATCEMFVS